MRAAIKPIPTGSGRILFPHQREAVAYAQRVGHPAFLMEMRTGKTLATIEWVRGLELRSVVVVCPSPVVRSWQQELDREGETWLDASGLSPEKKTHLGACVWGGVCRKWLLINYEGLRVLPILANVDWDCAICDESSKFRNPKAQITRLLLRRFRSARHRAILTGTPTPENLLEIYPQMAFLDGHFMGYRDFWKFRTELFEQGWDGYTWKPRPGVRERIKAAIHKRGFVLRRVDVQSGGSGREESERKVYQSRFVAMSSFQRKAYRQIEREFAFEENSTKWAVTQHLWLSKVAGGFDPEDRLLSDAKCRELVSLLTGELQGESVVVWFRFRHELEYAQKALQAARVAVSRIWGGMRPEDRREALEAFDSGISRVLLATVQTGQYGLDCSKADTAIYYSNDWSCLSRMQSEDRIEHPSKTKQLLIIDLITQGSVDEDVVSILREKKVASVSTMIDDRSFVRIIRGAIRGRVAV